MGVAVYRDIEGELHPRSETSRHHLFARSLTGKGWLRKWINQYPLTPRMLDEYHNTTEKALHTNVPLLRPPKLFVAHALQGVINDLDTVGQYNQVIEFTDRVDYLGDHAGNAEIRRECGRIAENLEMQMPYILLGQVEVVRDGIVG